MREFGREPLDKTVGVVSFLDNGKMELDIWTHPLRKRLIYIYICKYFCFKCQPVFPQLSHYFFAVSKYCKAEQDGTQGSDI